MATKTDRPTVTAVEIQARITKALRGQPPQAPKAVAAATDLAYSTVTQYLRTMAQAGTVLAVKDGRSNLYGMPTGKVTAAERAAAADGAALRAADHQEHAHVKAPRKRTTKAAPEAATDTLDETRAKLRKRAGAKATGKAPESAVAASTPRAATKPPAKAAPDGGGQVAAVLGRLRTVRPEPPAAEPPAPRKRAKAAPADVRSWKHGELRDAVLNWYRQNTSKKNAATPGACAKAIRAFQQPVATNCARLAAAGSLALVDEKPVSYRAG